MNISDTISDVATFTELDYTVFTILLSFSVAIGIYFAFFSGKLKTNEDYVAGGHNMKAIPIGISLVARYLLDISYWLKSAFIGWKFVFID